MSTRVIHVLPLCIYFADVFSFGTLPGSLACIFSFEQVLTSQQVMYTNYDSCFQYFQGCYHLNIEGINIEQVWVHALFAEQVFVNEAPCVRIPLLPNCKTPLLLQSLNLDHLTILVHSTSFNMANVALTEELDAINAIYGQETLSPLGEYAGNIRLRLGLPTEEKLVYWLQFESDYPHTIPQIEKAELSLHQSTDRRNQNIFLILFTVLQEVFVTGNVCLFDLVDGVLPLIASLCNYSLKNESGQSIVPSIVPLKWKWTCKPFIDMDVARNTMQCQTCFDKLYAFEMILVPCGHFFCFECFARKFRPPL